MKPGFKQTEVGVIPEEWEVQQMGKISAITTGRKDVNEGNPNGEFPFFTCSRVHTFSNSYSFDTEAILIAGNGDVGNLHYYSGQFEAYQRTYVVHKFSVHVQYLLHQLHYRLIESLGLGKIGTSIPYIKKENLTGFSFPLPPTLAEQEAIASALGDADALIESLERLVAKKRDVKQGAMQELLTARRRLPSFTGEWEEKPFRIICWFQEGPGVRNTQFTTSGVKLLNGTNIFRGKLNLDSTSRYISEHEAYGPYAHFLADAGDIVIASSGIAIDRFHEKVAFVESCDLPFCMNTSTIRFKPVAEQLTPAFLFQYLTSDSFKRAIGGQATGSAQLNFGPSHVEKVYVILPPVEEQTAIAAVLSDMDAELAALEAKLSKARAIKQGMMQELLTGRIRLK